jgi:hypothetical protein
MGTRQAGIIAWLRIRDRVDIKFSAGFCRNLFRHGSAAHKSLDTTKMNKMNDG